MGGLVLDIYIAFLIRTTVNVWRNIVSAAWPVQSGKITSCRYRHPGFGCDYAEYRYKYSVDGGTFKGAYIEPFAIGRTKAAQKSSSIGADIQVRVCPSNPARSVPVNF